MLAERREVFESLPMHKILGASDTGCSRSSRGVKGFGFIMTLDAEDAVDPAVFMLRQTHVIDVSSRGIISIGHSNGFVPETPSVDTVIGLCDREKRLAVSPLHTRYDSVFAVELDGTGIEYCVHHDTLHEIGIRLFIEVIPPFERCVLRSENRIFILGINPIPAFYRFVLSIQ